MPEKLLSSRAGIFAALLLATASVYAAPQDKPSGPNKDRKEQMEARFKKMEKELGLTPDQEKKLEENRKAHWQQSHQLFEQMREKRQSLEAEMEKPDMNADKVKSLHNDLKEIHNKLADQRLDGILEVRKILTPEQFKKFHELTKKEWGHGRRFHDRDGDRGPRHDDDGPDDMPPPPMK